MVYRRSSRRKFASRSRTAKSRYGRKRTGITRRRAYRRPRAMSTRVLLNKTSQKKRDNMLSYTNTTAADPFSTTYSATGAVMRFPVGQTNPGSEFFYIWNATARPAETSEGQRGSKLDTSLRTSESIYAKGLRERITLETNNAAPWEWRRICFTSKDSFGQVDPDTATFFRQTSNGMVRMLSALWQVSTFKMNYLREHGTLIGCPSSPPPSLGRTSPSSMTRVESYDPQITPEQYESSSFGTQWSQI